jgi:hypothetical protein
MARWLKKASLAERYDVSIRTIDRLIRKIRDESPGSVEMLESGHVRVRVEIADDFMFYGRRKKKKPMPVAAGHEHGKC